MQSERLYTFGIGRRQRFNLLLCVKTSFPNTEVFCPSKFVHLAKQFLMLLWASCMVQRWFFISASLHLWLAASFRAYVWVSLFSNSPLNLLICLMVDVSAIWTLQCPGHSKCFGGVNVCLIHLLFTWRLAQLFVVIAFMDTPEVFRAHHGGN